MGQQCLKKSLMRFKICWYALIVDEATDISHTEQLSVTMQWIDKNYQVHKGTLGLKESKLKFFTMKSKVFL